MSEKPPEVLALHDVAGTAFEVLRRSFDVPGSYAFALDDVDALVGRRSDAVDVAAFAMRGMQVVRTYALPQRPVAADHFVGVATSLVTALEKLAGGLDGDERERLLATRDRLHDAVWAVVRDTGGPGSGLCTLW